MAQLEVLLYLREIGDRSVTADSLGRDHKIGREMAHDLLTDLHGRGFLKQSGEEFAYKPTAALGRQVDSLAQAYWTYRVSIINLIFSKPSEGVQSFADAFRVRRDEDE